MSTSEIRTSCHFNPRGDPSITGRYEVFSAIVDAWYGYTQHHYYKESVATTTHFTLHYMEQYPAMMIMPPVVCKKNIFHSFRYTQPVEKYSFLAPVILFFTQLQFF